jgi:hypothetical protein
MPVYIINVAILIFGYFKVNLTFNFNKRCINVYYVFNTFVLVHTDSPYQLGWYKLWEVFPKLLRDRKSCGHKMVNSGNQW